MTKNHDVYFLRTIIVLLSFFAVVFNYFLLKKAFDCNKNSTMIAPILLLALIPGFFYSSVKFYLEIPALLAATAVIWSLITKQKPWIVGLILTLIIFTKEYYFFLFLPASMVVIFFDTIVNNSTRFWTKLKSVVTNLLLVGLPGLLVSMFLVDFNIGPYPRMLENSWIELFRDSFTLVNKYFLIIIDKIVSLFSVHGLSNFNHVVSQAQQIPIGNKFVTSAVLESPISSEKYSVLHTLWVMYKSNFYEQDISLFIVVLTIVGIVISFKKIIRTAKGQKFIRNRIEVVFLSIIFMFIFFNIQQAKNMQGFRINIPLVFVMIYFSYTALKKLLKEKSIKLSLSFLILTCFFTALYSIQDRSVSLSSVITGSLVSFIFSFKTYIFAFSFIVFALFLAFNNWLPCSKETKKIILIIFATFYFLLKFIPFIFDYSAEMQAHGNYFNVNNAGKVMHEALDSKSVIYTNLTCHVVYYESQWYKLPNDDFSPRYRTIPTTYPTLCKDFEYKNISSYFDALRINGKAYILFVNNNRYNRLTDFEQFYNHNRDEINVIDSEYKNNIPLWYFIEYKTDKPKVN